MLESTIGYVIVSLQLPIDPSTIIFFKGGALLKVTSNPGYHMMIPFLTTHRSVQVKKQINPSLSQDANYGANRSPCNLMKWRMCLAAPAAVSCFILTESKWSTFSALPAVSVVIQKTGTVSLTSLSSLLSVYEIVKNYTADYDKTLIYNKIHHELNQFCSVHSLQEVSSITLPSFFHIMVTPSPRCILTCLTKLTRTSKKPCRMISTS